jgi:hypothetical protein
MARWLTLEAVRITQATVEHRFRNSVEKCELVHVP